MSVTNPASSSPAFTVISSQSSPASSVNDGAACISPPTDLQIVKSGPASAPTGSTVTWQLTVKNNGPTVSSGYVVTQADLGHGSITGTATATGTPPTGSAITVSSNTVTITAHRSGCWWY